MTESARTLVVSDAIQRSVTSLGCVVVKRWPVLRQRDTIRKSNITTIITATKLQDFNDAGNDGTWASETSLTQGHVYGGGDWLTVFSTSRRLSCCIVVVVVDGSNASFIRLWGLDDET